MLTGRMVLFVQCRAGRLGCADRTVPHNSTRNEDNPTRVATSILESIVSILPKTQIRRICTSFRDIKPSWIQKMPLAMRTYQRVKQDRQCQVSVIALGSINTSAGGKRHLQVRCDEDTIDNVLLPIDEEIRSTLGVLSSGPCWMSPITVDGLMVKFPYRYNKYECIFDHIHGPGEIVTSTMVQAGTRLLLSLRASHAYRTDSYTTFSFVVTRCTFVDEVFGT